jgi:ribose transport system substrate-binding protein
MKKLVLVLLCFILVLPGLFAKGGQQADDGKLYIAMISKGYQHQFWQYVKVGADKAAAELGVTITFEGPESESQIDKQSEMFETALGRNPKGICFGALDAQAQIVLVEKAKARGIPVVTFDATVSSDIPASFVATDSAAAGAAAAEKMAAAIGGSGKVALIASDQTNTTQILRRDGFVKRMKEKYPGVQMLEPQYGDGDPLKSTEICKAVINANPDLKGFYACNEGSAIGLANAMTELKMKGKLIGIGFDSGKTQIDAIRNGVLYGAIQQNPVKIGYEAVSLCVKAIKGESVPKVVDSGFVWSDQSNIDSPEVKAVIYE